MKKINDTTDTKDPQIPQEIAMAAMMNAMEADSLKDLTDLDKEMKRQVQQGFLDFLNSQKAKEDAAKEEVERRYEASRKRIEETEAQANLEKASCSHLKQGGRDYRIGGQVLSSGQLRVSCQWCQEEWYQPADPKLGQKPIPHEIFIRLNGDNIGSAIA